MAKYILKHNELIVLNSEGKPVAGFKVKDPMEGLFDRKSLNNMPVTKDYFAMAQAEYNGSYYDLSSS